MKRKDFKFVGISTLALSILLNTGCKNDNVLKLDEQVESIEVTEVEERKYNISEILVVRITDKTNSTDKYILCDSFEQKEEYFTSTYIENYVMDNLIIDDKKISNPISLNQPNGYGWIYRFHSILDDSYYVNNLKYLESDTIYYYDSILEVKAFDTLYTKNTSVLRTNKNLFDENVDEEISFSKYNCSMIDLTNQEIMTKSEEDIIDIETFFLDDLLNMNKDAEFNIKELSNIQNELNYAKVLSKKLH